MCAAVAALTAHHVVPSGAAPDVHVAGCAHTRVPTAAPGVQQPSRGQVDVPAASCGLGGGAGIPSAGARGLCVPLLLLTVVVLLQQPARCGQVGIEHSSTAGLGGTKNCGEGPWLRVSVLQSRACYRSRWAGCGRWKFIRVLGSLLGSSRPTVWCSRVINVLSRPVGLPRARGLPLQPAPDVLAKLELITLIIKQF